MPDLGVGLIGAGYIGHTIALAYRAVAAVFPQAGRPRLVALADVNEAAAAKAAGRYGFARATGDWRSLLADPAIEIVAIATPNHLHAEMAEAALAAGKHVHCEKPMAPSLTQAESMAWVARGAAGRTIVGYNYLHNPVLAAAREIVAGGEIGTPLHFRGTHNEDYMADPAGPFSWRCERALAGAGALGDLGAHIVSMAHTLMGGIAEVCGDLTTVVKERPLAGSGMRRVENEDQAQFLVRFASGASGTVEASRVAQGRKMGLGFEITGSRGALVFDQTRLNELRLYRAGQAPGRQGFTTILAGPEHPGYAAFCPAPGHQIGFNDLKVIEVARFLEAIAAGTPAYPDFAAALQFERVLDAVQRSAVERRWIGIGTG
jgi:predicted dehydrogenase